MRPGHGEAVASVWRALDAAVRGVRDPHHVDHGATASKRRAHGMRPARIDVVTPIKSDEITSCSTCPCGQAAGVRFGGRCPLVDRKRRADETIFLEGDTVSSVWFVKRGTVVLSRAGADDVEHPHAVRGPGTFIGLEALVRATYADTARTTEPSVLCGIGRTALDAWFGPRGTPARMALEVTLETECATSPRAAAADGTSVQRVARWLLDRGDVDHHVPRTVMASLLGMVPETLSRALARLGHAGAIHVGRRHVAIRDRAALAEVAR